MDSFIEAWENVCTYCKNNLTETAYSAFVKDLTPVSLEDGVANLLLELNFKRKLLKHII